MADITRSTAAPFIPTIIANSALEVLRAYIVLAQVVTKDSDIAPFSVGDTLNIPFPGTAEDRDEFTLRGVPEQAQQRRECRRGVRKIHDHPEWLPTAHMLQMPHDIPPLR